MNQTKKLSLKDRLRRLFARKMQPSAIPQAEAGLGQHQEQDMAFRAGAAVAFVTPIGAYAGTTTEDDLRKRAEQQFMQMEITQHITMN